MLHAPRNPNARVASPLQCPTANYPSPDHQGIMPHSASEGNRWLLRQPVRCVTCAFWKKFNIITSWLYLPLGHLDRSVFCTTFPSRDGWLRHGKMEGKTYRHFKNLGAMQRAGLLSEVLGMPKYGAGGVGTTMAHLTLV